MGEEQVGLEISVEDLKALAQINPLAWAQLLHIADVRILKARIAELEEKNTSSGPSFIRTSNGSSGIAESVIA